MAFDKKKTPGCRVVSQAGDPDFWPRKLAKNGSNVNTKRTGWKGKGKRKSEGGEKRKA